MYIHMTCDIYTHTVYILFAGDSCGPKTHFYYILQIASYAVSPNYDILFFTSELMPISNILDYYAGEKTKTLEAVLADLTSVKIKGKFDN